MLKSKLYARIVKSVTSIDETARSMPKHPTPDSQKQNKPGLGGLILAKDLLWGTYLTVALIILYG